METTVLKNTDVFETIKEYASQYKEPVNVWAFMLSKIRFYGIDTGRLEEAKVTEFVSHDEKLCFYCTLHGEEFRFLIYEDWEEYIL